MGNFEQKVNKFIEIFIQQNGYVKVLEGLKNTLLIAILGLVIGILIGTLIATVRVIPKYKRLPRVLNGICSFYGTTWSSISAGCIWTGRMVETVYSHVFTFWTGTSCK